MSEAIQSNDDRVKVRDAPQAHEPDGATQAKADRSTKAHLKRLIGLLRPYRTRWILATATLLANSLVNLGLPQAVRIAIDDALKARDVDLLGLIALLGGIGFVVMGLLTAYRHYLMSWLGNRVVADLRAKSFEHLLRFSPGFFHERKTGELVSRLTDDIGALQHTVGSELSISIRSALTVVGGLVILFITSPYLTAVMLLMIPPISIMAVVIGRLIRRRAREMQDLVAQANSGLKESLSGIETVQTFTAEAIEAGRYRDRVFAAFRTSLKLAIYRGSFVAGVQIAAFSAVTVIVWLGGQAVINDELTAGAMTVFLIYTVMVATSLASLANIWGNLQRAVGASDRIFALLDEEPDIRDRDDALALPEPRGDITFENVDFTYPTRPDVQVLKNVSFGASPGDTIALVGRSGAGKSTIAALLHRFFDPQLGAVTIDGHDLRALKLENVRRVIGTVSQDPVLFSGTIGENIAYGCPGASDEAIQAAGVDAHVAEFVERLPLGYDTLVGERGVKLSGGQRQRVAIARAILADPRILILDEATSHLDSENEGLVHAALETLMTGRTTLIIAHRLSTVQNATRILVMEQGRVVESGTHAELLANGPVYRKLTRSQIVEGE
ncbi:MAG: ABC transporter fused permease/ATP-binding protein [Myxococcota bacterium]|jgi:ABC transporter fused permease/ATP-binding protein